MSKYQKSIFFSVFFCCLLLVVFSASAASLNLISQSNKVVVGQQFKVDLILNGEEGINALEGKVSFPDSIELLEIREGNSIISFWVERPVFKQGLISFSGIIPGGYTGRGGLIFSLVLKETEEGSRTIEVKNGNVLLNDGQGTPASLSVSNFKFTAVKSAAQPEGTKPPAIAEIKDVEPPESFILQVARESNMFDGKWFLVFATQDKNSGVDYYASKEIRHFRFWELGFWKKQPEVSWQKVESPYLLADQNLRSDIFVKAVDKSGNEMVVTYSAELKPWYQEWPVDIAIGLTVLIVVLLIMWRLWRKNTKHHK